jgi:hypothetical protein
MDKFLNLTGYILKLHNIMTIARASHGLATSIYKTALFYTSPRITIHTPSHHPGPAHPSRRSISHAGARDWTCVTRGEEGGGRRDFFGVRFLFFSVFPSVYFQFTVSFFYCFFLSVSFSIFLIQMYANFIYVHIQTLYTRIQSLYTHVYKVCIRVNTNLYIYRHTHSVVLVVV